MISYKPYSFKTLWDAVSVINPKQPIESGREHVFSMIIPNIIATELAHRELGPPQPINIAKNVAFNTLLSAYWDLVKTGCFKLEGEE